MSAAFSLQEQFDDALARTLRTTVLFRLVDFVCPHCGDERAGAYVDGDDGTAYVECCDCHHELDVAVLQVPTQARIEGWRADAVHHGTTALQFADGSHRCSYLAEASCRRLAPELTQIGKVRLLDELAQAVGPELTIPQRHVLVELGAALGLPAPAINALVALH